VNKDIIDMPINFIDNSNKLKTIVPYITEQLWANLGVCAFLNAHTNDLHNIPDPIELLLLLKKIFLYHNITKFNLNNINQSWGADLIKEIEERELYDENNARSKLIMTKYAGGDISQYIKKNPTRKNAFVDQQQLTSVVNKVLEKEKNILPQHTNYLEDLTQEIIDSMGLIIFDTNILKKRNEILYTFIDLNNIKHYYVEPFEATIYLSKVDGVINNDYIEDKVDSKFVEYTLTDIKDYNRLKFMLGNSYKRIINGITRSKE